MEIDSRMKCRFNMNTKNIIFWLSSSTVLMPLFWAILASVFKAYKVWMHVENISASIERGSQVFIFASIHFFQVSFLLMLPAMAIMTFFFHKKEINFVTVVLNGITISIFVAFFTPMISSMEIGSFILFCGTLFINFILPYLFIAIKSKREIANSSISEDTL